MGDHGRDFGTGWSRVICPSHPECPVNTSRVLSGSRPCTCCSPRLPGARFPGCSLPHGRQPRSPALTLLWVPPPVRGVRSDAIEPDVLPATRLGGRGRLAPLTQLLCACTPPPPCRRPPPSAKAQNRLFFLNLTSHLPLLSLPDSFSAVVVIFFNDLFISFKLF